MKPSIVIATRSNVLNKKICDLLNRTNCYDILKVCSSFHDAQTYLLDHKPNLTILSADYKEGSGVCIAGKLKKHRVLTKVAILSENEDITLMRLALEYGVRAYFNYMHDGQIFECINAINKNEFYIDTKLYHSHFFSKVG